MAKARPGGLPDPVPGDPSAPSLAPPVPGALTFDLGAAVEHLRRADRTLAKLISSVGPCQLELEATPDTFTALARAVVSQQLSPKAAAAIYGRLVGLGPSPASVLAGGEGSLRAVGLSGAKERALMDLAVRAVAGTLPSLADMELMDDESVIARLSEIRGVGRWTAEMFLVFSLGRPDVLSLGDYGLRRGFQIAYGLAEVPSPVQLAERGRRWVPYRSVASWYLWRAVEGMRPDRKGAPG